MDLRLLLDRFCRLPSLSIGVYALGLGYPPNTADKVAKLQPANIRAAPFGIPLHSLFEAKGIAGVNRHILSARASMVTGEPLKDCKLPESKCKKIGKSLWIFNFLHNINHSDISSKQANIKQYQIENTESQAKFLPADGDQENISISCGGRDKQISERTHTGKEENSLATTTKDQSSETLYQALDSEKDIQQRDFVQQMMDSLPGPSCEINRKLLFLESSLVLAKRPNSKKRLVSAGILSELCGNNIHQGPKVAFQDLRNEEP
ncbi:hypothetical protein KIW84_042097 [Lathyrus oleraceus]|uniref:Uncharacterized protein n=1 Tax=Pisum sativum TaxID=3888 RepID=A0A9D4XA67_PEA|nr:hypothetical protein KIW84_042097 [Pisum sativum]